MPLPNILKSWIRKVFPGSTKKHNYLVGKLQAPDSRPVVLLCAHKSGPYIFGAQRSLIDTLDGLRRIGISAICTLPTTDNRDYIDAVLERSAGVYVFSYRQWGPAPEAEAVIRSFMEIIRTHNVDVVHANTIMLREPLTAAQRCGVTTVIHAREIITNDQDVARRIGITPDEIVRQVAYRADFIIANSEATAECFKDLSPVWVVPNTVDIDQLDIPNEVDPGNVRFALVSNNERKKGLDDLIELAARCETIVHNALFLAVGPPGEYVDALKNDHEEGILPRNIEFSGYKNTPREAMAEANVILNLSYVKESFGRTVLEAMAARRPVIAYDWGALSEIIRHGENGYLVGFRNIDQLVTAIKTLCENPRLISEMGTQGRECAILYYSPETLTERLRDAYTHILTEKDSRLQARNLDLLRKAPPTTIIIPVYNAYEELRQCIASVQKHTDLTENRLLVMDDASDDPRVNEYLNSLTNVQVVRNERNMGYTRTCNKGISLASSCDIVLLNSDTIVTPWWLESLRLAAYSAPEVGTATALSDNAGAFSVPLANQLNAKPDEVTHEDYALLMRKFCRACTIPDVPTGNGFCMFIKRDLIKRIGRFDEQAFPRGYGEENDFCMRAVNAGWRNVIAPAAFVFHQRNASFQGEKDSLAASGREIINKRYPNYSRLVKEAFSCSTMEDLRRATERAVIAAREQVVKNHVRTGLEGAMVSLEEQREINGIEADKQV